MSVAVYRQTLVLALRRQLECLSEINIAKQEDRVTFTALAHFRNIGHYVGKFAVSMTCSFHLERSQINLAGFSVQAILILAIGDCRNDSGNVEHIVKVSRFRLEDQLTIGHLISGQLDAAAYCSVQRYGIETACEVYRSVSGNSLLYCNRRSGCNIQYRTFRKIQLIYGERFIDCEVTCHIQLTKTGNFSHLRPAFCRERCFCCACYI